MTDVNYWLRFSSSTASTYEYNHFIYDFKDKSKIKIVKKEAPEVKKEKEIELIFNPEELDI